MHAEQTQLNFRSGGPSLAEEMRAAEHRRNKRHLQKLLLEWRLSEYKMYKGFDRRK